MNLSDTEKQEIIRAVEAGKPLPEKYRFLLFDDDREVELVWNGKTNRVTNAVLPFQTIEQVDEPRTEKHITANLDLFSAQTGRQKSGWNNKLIWGDNKLILSSLKNGPMRDEIEAQGGIKLIYIDPPFDVGADFSMDIDIGDDSFTKKPNILEEIAYRDTWGRGADSFLSMIYERLIIMRDLLADDGGIYVHCDWRVNSFMRTILDEVFGTSCYRNALIWKKIRVVKAQANSFGNVHDYIYFYDKGQTFNKVTKPQSKKYYEKFDKIEKETGMKYQLVSLIQKGQGPARSFNGKVIDPKPGMHWIWGQDRIDAAFKEGLIEFTSSGNPRKKQYLDESGERLVDDLWTEIYPVNSQAKESVDYPTQKPEALLERIIKASSNPGDLVADFFCGSGTTCAVAEKLGRKWIGSDLGKFAIHTTRKRMIGVQREMKSENKDYRAFEILNLGKYERAHYVGVNPGLRAEAREAQLAAREQEFLNLILHAYRAEATEGFTAFAGKKAGRVVAVGPVNLPVTRMFVENIINECRQKRITKVDVLGFEFEMGLFPNVLDEAASKGIDISPKYIPRDVFDKRAVEKNQVVFHDVAFIEVKPIVKGGKLSVQLTDFSVNYAQDSVKHAEETLKSGKSKIVVEKGQIVKVKHNKDGTYEREVLTEKWTDWIDYWSVDFDWESKQEMIRVEREDGEGYDEIWTGDYVFENEWQSFRTKKDRSIDLTSAAIDAAPGKRKVAVKVVDIFGNDTMAIAEVNI